MPELTRPRVVTTLFMAEGVTRVGDAITMVALPLTAILVLDASPAGLALIGAAQAAPILLLSLPAGAWVDRRARRWSILVTADVFRGFLLASVPIAAVMGVLSLPFLAGVALAASACGTLFDLAFAGWVPRLLAGDALHRANARIELARSAASVTGPAIGGVLVAALTAPFALLADAASFIGSAALIARVRAGEPIPPAPTARAPLRTELSAGLRFIGRQPLVRAVTLTAGINNLARSIAMSVAVLYLVDSARMDAAQIGLAFALGNSGFVIGALVSRRLSERLGMGSTMQLGVGLFGPSMLLFAAAPPSLSGLACTLMIFAHGFGIAVHNVNQVTVRQVLT
ncbi:MAG TPA: MFS transporter, partial [Candidatus Limnocylindria bacterium]|nr:MFS transporter [Candidatus Limnocylindria bacterium]